MIMNNTLNKNMYILLTLILIISVTTLCQHAAAGNSSPAPKDKNTAPKPKIKYLDEKTDPFMLIDKGENIGDFKDATIQKIKELSGVTLMEEQQLSDKTIKAWAQNTQTLKQEQAKARERVAAFKEQIRELHEKRQFTCESDKKERLRLKARMEHAKYQKSRDEKRIRELNSRLERENQKRSEKLAPKESTFEERANRYLSNTGQYLSLFDAAKKSYYEKEILDKNGKPTGRTEIDFSWTAYGYHSMMNLTGLCGITGTFSAASKAKKDKLDEIMEEYRRKGQKVTPKMFHDALLRASATGLLVGIYNGAKCVRTVGDIISTGELIYESGMLVHDTIVSNRIQAENKKIQKEQNTDARARLEAKFKEYKDYRKEFEDIQRDCEVLGKQIQLQRKQFIELFKHSAELQKEMAPADQLADADRTAAPFMQKGWVEKLQQDTNTLIHSVEATEKLADMTMDSGNSDALKKTAAELSAMVDTLESYRQECSDAQKALMPLAQGQATMLKSNELAGQAVQNTNGLMDAITTANDLFKIYGEKIKQARKLRRDQDQVMDKCRRLLSYFHRERGDSMRIQLDTMLQETLQYKIDDYALNKLDQQYGSIAFAMRDFRTDAVYIPEGLPPELAEGIVLAQKLTPELAKLQGLIDTAITSARMTMARLDAAAAKPDIQMADTRIRSSQDTAGATYGSRDFSNMSLKSVASEVSFTAKNKKPADGEGKLGFVFHTRDNNQDHQRWDDPDSKPIYYDTFRKLLEKGSITIWTDTNADNKKDAGEEKVVPYWIWYDIGNSGVEVRGGHHLIGRIKHAEERCYDIPWLVNTARFQDTNVMFGITGYLKGGATGPSHTIDARAAFPPFESKVRIKVVIQVAGSIWDIDELQESRLWIMEKNKDEILQKAAFWETGMEKTARSLLDSSLELPRKYAEYLEKHLFLNAYLTQDITLDGFETIRTSKKSGAYWKRSFYKDMKRNTVSFVHVSDRHQRRIKTREDFTIWIRIRFPDDNQTLKEFFKELQARQAKRFRKTFSRAKIEKIDIPNSNFSLMWTKRKNHPITNGYGVVLKNKFDLSERILMVRNNAVVEIAGSGSDMLGDAPHLRTMELARKIIAKFKKPRVNN